MPAPRAHSQLVAAARMYYLEGKSQADIAKSLEVSRSSVSRILSAARANGIVEIRIHPDGGLARREDLERSLITLCGLTQAYVVSRPIGRDPVDVVAEMAARLLEENLPTLLSLGLSWGQTLAKMVEHVLVEPIYPNLDVYPLVGGMPTLSTGPAGNVSIEILARKCGARRNRFDSPALVESRVTSAALLGESSIQRALDDASRVQTAFVGIGSVGVHASMRVVEAMGLSEAEERRFAAQEPAGDICGRFYDINGGIIGPPTSERVIGLSLEQLAHVPTVFGVAAGIEKVSGTVGALRTGALDVIVLDDELAQAVVEMLRSH